MLLKISPKRFMVVVEACLYRTQTHKMTWCLQTQDASILRYNFSKVCYLFVKHYQYEEVITTKSCVN